MKKRTLGTTFVAAALACSMIPGTAAAAARMRTMGGMQTAGIAQSAARAGLSQQAGEVLDGKTGNLQISEAGTYVLQGELRGTVRVDPGAGDVTLVMDNAVIDGNGGPAIQAVSGDSLTISLPEGTSSRVNSSGSDAAAKATIEGTVDMRFEGPGALTVVGDQKPAFQAENADMTFNGGNFEVVSAGNGMEFGGAAPGAMTVNDADLNFHVGGDMVLPGSAVVRNGGSMQEGGFSADFGYDRYLSQNPWGAMQQGPQGSMQQGGAPVGMPAPGQLGNGQQATMASGAKVSMPWATGPQGGQPAQLPNGSVPSMQAGQPGSGNAFQQGGQPGQQMGFQPGQAWQAGNQAGTPSQPSQQTGFQPGQPSQGSQNAGYQPGGTMPGQPGQQAITGTTDTAGEIVTSSVENTAASLVADITNAIRYVMSEVNNQVKISEAGTYIVTGSSSDGNITVKKGTEGVVLILDNLDLTSTTGATLSVNKEAEVKLIIEGNVTLTDNENPEDENSTDADVADAFDGAAIKAKAGSSLYITGDGTLNVNGNAKNGIKAGDDTNLVIDGTTLNINAANDGINGNYDVTILSGDVTVSAGDDAIHADHILTIGDQQTGEGPTIDVKSSTEGLEGTVVNMFGGDVTVKSSDDAVNAANGDGLYEGELDYSFNMTGGDLTIKSTGDGIDSNGNVNLVGGSATIESSAGGGEAGIDYDGDLYVSDDFELNNASGVSGADMMGGQPGQMGGDMMGSQPGQMGGAPSDMGGQPGQMGGSMGGQPGQR